MPLGTNGSILVGTIPNSTFIDVNTPTPELEVNYEVIIPSVATWNRYYTPLGNYFFDSPGQTTLDLDTGSGFVPQVFGVDYVNQQRGFNRAAAPITDIGIGFRYIAGVVPAGWIFRFRWKSRKILISPIAVAAVRIVGGSVDYTVPWKISDPAKVPNGISVPSVPSYLVEIWRLTYNRGGNKGGTNIIPTGGKRFVPYFRGVANQFLFDLTFMATGSHKDKFKVCYYNNITGARSQLSTDMITHVNTHKDDTLGSSGYIRTYRYATWIGI